MNIKDTSVSKVLFFCITKITEKVTKSHSDLHRLHVPCTSLLKYLKNKQLSKNTSNFVDDVTFKCLTLKNDY